LQRQHLVAVQAAAELSAAEVEGAELQSQHIRFTPGRVTPGEYAFDIGSAGSTTLVAQTVLPPLMKASAPSHITIKGGTHNPLAPPVDFLREAFAPLVAQIGPRVEPRCVNYGFFPEGKGRLEVGITPAKSLAPLHLHERGAWLGGHAWAFVGKLPLHIAERELAVIRSEFAWPDAELEAISADNTRGNVVVLALRYERVSEVVISFGERGLPAEEVARAAIREARRYLDETDVPVGEHLADQLLIPLALAGAGSFVTGPLSQHTTTNMETIGRFLPVKFKSQEQSPGRWLVEVRRE
jgi:RNA 3'-terminal phosphate cyclase (ATP)